MTTIVTGSIARRPSARRPSAPKSRRAEVLAAVAEFERATAANREARAAYALLPDPTCTQGLACELAGHRWVDAERELMRMIEAVTADRPGPDLDENGHRRGGSIGVGPRTYTIHEVRDLDTRDIVVSADVVKFG
jgi:hypothetical protein